MRKNKLFVLVLASNLLAWGGCKNDDSVSRKTPAVESCQTVITLGPTLTELVLALERQDRLLAVSRYDRLPAGISKTRVGGLLDPEIEAILSLAPDCLLYVPAGPTMESKLAPLIATGIKVQSLEVANLAALPAVTARLGHLLQAEGQAATLVRQWQKSQKEADGLAVKGRRVLIIYDYAPLVVAGKGSMGDELLNDSGMINAIAADGYPIIDEEYLASLSIDLVIDLSFGNHHADLSRLLSPTAKIIRADKEALRHPSPDSWATWIEFLREIK